jgi:hypothetical protein
MKEEKEQEVKLTVAKYEKIIQDLKAQNEKDKKFLESEH